jgi:predicted nucleic acid-binding protein
MSHLLSKKELRIKSGLSETTFRQYVNARYLDELTAMGYRKTQKILTPEQTRFLIDRLVIVDE